MIPFVMSEKDMDNYSYEELKNMVMPIAKKELAFIGEFKDNIPSYEQLNKLLNWLLEHFNYTSDAQAYGKDDFWDPRDWLKPFLQGSLDHDCNSYGYAILGIMIEVFNVNKSDVFRVACAAESGEGHFVAWAKCTDGIVYQVENRMPMFGSKPRSVKYMKDVGYEYWYYSSMSHEDISTNTWYDAPEAVGKLMYNTPINLEADKPVFEMSKAIRIDKSKDLLLKWSQGIFAGISTFFAFTAQNAQVVSSTVQMHRVDFTNIFDAKTVSIIMLVASIAGIYIRVVTNKDLNHKRGYDG